jgi:hypothetical protein
VNLPNDSDDFRPEVSIISVALAFSSNGVRLAREARMDAIHFSFPVGCVEHPNVSLEHLQVWEPSFGGSFPEDLATVGVPFDGADGIMSENKVGEESTAGPGEQMERSHFISTYPRTSRGTLLQGEPKWRQLLQSTTQRQLFRSFLLDAKRHRPGVLVLCESVKILGRLYARFLRRKAFDRF